MWIKKCTTYTSVVLTFLFLSLFCIFLYFSFHTLVPHFCSRPFSRSWTLFVRSILWEMGHMYLGIYSWRFVISWQLSGSLHTLWPNISLLQENSNSCWFSFWVFWNEPGSHSSFTRTEIRFPLLRSSTILGKIFNLRLLAMLSHFKIAEGSVEFFRNWL